MKLISVHTPKAGGTSTAHSLRSTFGRSFLGETEDDPANPGSERNINPKRYFSRNRDLPPGIKCIHGHFHPGQFNLKDDIFLFTILRHPIENIISIYCFWKSLPPQGSLVHDYFLKEKLSIVDMACLPLIRWLYSHTYFGDFDMGRFNLIGCHENREKALQDLAAQMGLALDTEKHENRGPINEERRAIMSDHVTIRRLNSILSDDIRFYEVFCSKT